MSLQKQWVQIMNPLRSMLNFQLKGLGSRFAYLPGKFSMPVWSDPKAQNRQLVVGQCSIKTKLRTYDCAKAENDLKWINGVDRGTSEYDLRAEARIFEEYACLVKQRNKGVFCKLIYFNWN